MVDPKKMCDRHLLGEHVELHMLAGNIKRGRSIDGYLGGLVEPGLMVQRHCELVKEMACRGMKHQSPLDCPAEAASASKAQPISEATNLRELVRRCERCASLIKGA